MKNIFETSEETIPFERVVRIKGYWVELEGSKHDVTLLPDEMNRFKKEWNKYLERKISGINDFISIKNKAIPCRYRTRIRGTEVIEFKFGKWKDGLFLGYKKDELGVGYIYDEKTKKVIIVWIDSHVIFTGDSDG